MDLPDPNPPQPSKFVVVPGTLARELVAGQIATGATQSEARAPADVPIAGDSGDATAPTYATFNKLGAGTDAGKAQDRTGQVVNETLARDGTIGSMPQTPTEGELPPSTPSPVSVSAGTYVAFVPETGHNIPGVFLDYFKAQSWNWIYIAGYPISEAYWATVLVGGVPHAVLEQVYERRTVTFDPAAPDGYKVQFGNVGRHYYDWRYGTK